MRYAPRLWTKADDAELRHLAASDLSRIEIARRLNRTVSATEGRAYKLGIKLASSTRRAPVLEE